MLNVYKRISLGDMNAYYLQDDVQENLELLLLPADLEPNLAERANVKPDSMIQLHLTGDLHPGHYAAGRTMHLSHSTLKMKPVGQDVEEKDGVTTVTTTFADGRAHVAKHFLVYKSGKKSVRSYVTFENQSEEKVSLEYIPSFTMGPLSPFDTDASYGNLLLHRIRSCWSMEGRVETLSFEDIQMEGSWIGHGVRAERFGQVGSMAVNGYFPYLAVEDTNQGIVWGAQLAHNASWEMEVYRQGPWVYMSGGLADREFGHWKKDVAPGEVFSTPEAILTVCRGKGIDAMSQRLTADLADAVDAGPESEQDLPVMFNEYCTTWGCPSAENIREIVDVIKDRGFSYFVIDAGWYKQPGIPWDQGMGDYEVSDELFPEGMQKTVDYIKAHGMKPGIWFEIDNVAPEAKAYQLKEHLLTRDGYPLETDQRTFWDMRDPFVQEYLGERVIGTLKNYGFEYMKMDYNDSIPIGCDGAESLGEGLRQNMAASHAFVKRVKEEIPGIILENCSSGGHKLEPLMMETCAMASFSDAHECKEIPIIAANLHRVILPRQSQIWAVIRETDSLQRIVYSVANTFLGRCCISGDVWKLSEKQWAMVDWGIAFYKRIAPIIKEGQTYFFGPKIVSYRHPKGWQGVLRVNDEGKAYALFTVFEDFDGQEMEIGLPEGCGLYIEDVYADTEPEVTVKEGKLRCMARGEYRNIAVYLEP